MSKQALNYSNIDVTSDVWTPIVTPTDCDYFSLLNTPGGWFGFGAQNVTLRSDPNDANTSK